MLSQPVFLLSNDYQLAYREPGGSSTHCSGRRPDLSESEETIDASARGLEMGY